MEKNCGHDGLQKEKKKGQHLVFHGLECTFANFFRSHSKFLSPLEIKDNSNFNKGQGRAVQIKDGWQPYIYSSPSYQAG